MTTVVTSVVFGSLVDNSFAMSSETGSLVSTPTPIVPSGASNTIILASPDANGNMNFSLDPIFQVGDVIEVYGVASGPFNIFDENGHQIVVTNVGVSDLGLGVRLRKIASGTVAPTWGKVV